MPRLRSMRAAVRARGRQTARMGTSEAARATAEAMFAAGPGTGLLRGVVSVEGVAGRNSPSAEPMRGKGRIARTRRDATSVQAASNIKAGRLGRWCSAGIAMSEQDSAFLEHLLQEVEDVLANLLRMDLVKDLEGMT